MEYTVSFVPTTEADVETMIHLRQKVWASTYRGIYPDSMIDEFDYPFHRKMEFQRIQDPTYFGYRIRKDGQDAGYLTLHSAKPLRVLSLYLLPEFQHMGIGKQAFAFAAKFCRECSENVFVLDCVPQNRNARAFYEHMGGQVIAQDLSNAESWQNSVTYAFQVNALQL